jgi:hypothetical protein
VWPGLSEVEARGSTLWPLPPSPDFASLNPGYLLDQFPGAAEDYTLVRCFLRIKNRQMKRHIVALVQCVADSQ